MTRSTKILTVAFAAGAVVLSTAGPANAQYAAFVRQRPTIYSHSPFGPVVMPFGYGVMPAYGLGINRSGAFFASPTGGYSFMSTRLYYSPSYYPTYPVTPVDYYSSFSSGYGSSMAAREKYYLRQAQQPGYYGVADAKVGYDRTAPDRGAKPVDPARWKNVPEALRLAITDPSEKAIASGQALNEVFKAIPDYEAKGAKAETPFLPADLLDKVVFAGDKAADALNLVRAGKVEFPESQRGAEFDTPREAIEKALAAAAVQVRDGKKIDIVLLDRIGENARKLKAKAGPMADDAAAVVARLEAAAKFLKSPDANGLFVPAWQSAGVSLSDLNKFMTKHKLQFGPAAAGDEGVYAAVHRGMVGYLNQLTQVKR